MTNYCLNKGFKVIQDDAIKTLKNFDSQSISVITIFHLIEHLDNSYLNQLMNSCYRVLAENGLLIIETPSIDNLLVSTKSFYLDPTHINHINPDGFSFLLEQKGFSKSNYYYINGGPLHSSSSSLKISKILNGVAQDITFIVSKSNKISKLIFEEETYWQRDFSNALSTLEAAVAYDLEIQNVMDESQKKYKKVVEELNQSKSEILLLKSEVKHLILLIKILKKIFKPFLSLFRYVVKKCIYILNKIFNLIIKFSIVRKTLKSENFLKFLNLFFSLFIGDSSSSLIMKIKNNIEKFSKNDYRSDRFNNLLRVHHQNSETSNYFLNLLKSNQFRKR